MQNALAAYLKRLANRAVFENVSANRNLLQLLFFGLKLRQRLQHVLPDGFRVVIKSCANEPQPIWRQYLSVIVSVA